MRRPRWEKHASGVPREGGGEGTQSTQAGQRHGAGGPCDWTSVGAGRMRIYACGTPFSGANCPSVSINVVEDSGLKERSGSEMLLLMSLLFETSRWLIVAAEEGEGFCDERTGTGGGRCPEEHLGFLSSQGRADNRWMGRGGDWVEHDTV